MSLEHCADALLQQRAVQNTNYEHLEGVIHGLERSRRSACLSLMLAISDVNRKRKDLSELRRTTEQLDSQLGQDKLKLSALALFVSDDKKHHTEIAQLLAALSSGWAVLPPRITQLVRALQERRVLLQDAKKMEVVLSLLHDVMSCIGVVQRVLPAMKTRLHGQSVHAEQALVSIHRKREAVQDGRTAEAAEHDSLLQQHAAAVEATHAAQQQIHMMRAETALRTLQTECLRHMVLLAREATVSASDHSDTVGKRLAEAEGVNQELTKTLLAVAAQHKALRRRTLAHCEANASKMAALKVALEATQTTAVDAQQTLDASCQRRVELEAELASATAVQKGAAVLLLFSTELFASQTASHNARTALEAERNAILVSLRRRHEELLCRRWEARKQQRYCESLQLQEAEESLVRKDLAVAASVAWDHILTAAASQRPSTVTRTRRSAVGTRRSAAFLREGQKRGRLTTPVLPETTVADELGLTVRKTYPFMGPLKHPGKDRRSAVLPANLLGSQFTGSQPPSPPPRKPARRPRQEPLSPLLRQPMETHSSLITEMRALGSTPNAPKQHHPIAARGATLRRVQATVFKPTKVLTGGRAAHHFGLCSIADGDDIFADDFL